MAIDYFEEKIIECESNYFGPFLGYINPSGQILDYSILQGVRGHDNWRNPVTPLFLEFISFVVLETDIEKFNVDSDTVSRRIYENNKYDGFDNFVLRGLHSIDFNITDYDSFLGRLKDTLKSVEKFSSSSDEWSLLKYDIMKFFEKCYSKNDFFYSFGRVIKLHSKQTVYDKYKDILAEDRSFEDFFYDYCIIMLMSYFKDILVQYLGYDSIERAIPEYDLTFANNLYEHSNGYTFLKKPTILTSCSNPNERFYNWLLMDWEIQRIPRMFWNENEKKFIGENFISIFHNYEKEKNLYLEIESIRKEIPKQYRKKYFRK